MQAPISLKRPAWVQEFQHFIMRGNVIDLAVGIIIGAAFTTVVSSLVRDIINPLIGLLIGGIDFSNIFITLKGLSQPTLEAARAAGAVTLNIGLFLNSIIQFLIVGFAIFWLIKVISRISQPASKPQPPTPTPTETLLREIRDLLAARAGDDAARKLSAS
jgi:large conductance mechanosensitive channel